MIRFSYSDEIPPLYSGQVRFPFFVILGLIIENIANTFSGS